MISEQEVRKAILRMREIGSDTQRWEVKESVTALPKSLPETLSAFANMHGGMIVLGLSERAGFRPAKGFDANRIFSQMQTVGDLMTPVVRMEIERIIFEGAPLVVAEVQKLPELQKPCYITARGRYEGSFIRSGDGDRHLSPYEVDRLWEMRRQPKFDLEPVEEAGLDELDPNKLERIVLRCREIFPRVFGNLPKEQILVQLGILARAGDRLCPTLAGLLAAGIFPQRRFPRLEVVFCAFPGTSKAPPEGSSERYLDAKEIIGSIPDMIWETLACVQQRMSTGAVVEGALRRDIPDYPLAAVREAIANALQHRDYSPEGRGTHVQVNLYSDRLEILNPGGLYGAASAEGLGKGGISSTRNEFLSRILAYTPFESGFVVENKGTGFMVIRSELEKAGLPPARIRNSPSFFSLTFEKRKALPAPGAPDEAHRREKDTETQAAEVPAAAAGESFSQTVIRKISKNGSASAKELAAASGLSRSGVTKNLKAMIAAGMIEPLFPARSPKQRYRLKN